jgi:hypothetical protein
MYVCATDTTFGDEMAYDGAISSDEESFTAYWKYRGTASLKADCP